MNESIISAHCLNFLFPYFSKNQRKLTKNRICHHFQAQNEHIRVKLKQHVVIMVHFLELGIFPLLTRRSPRRDLTLANKLVKDDIWREYSTDSSGLIRNTMFTFLKTRRRSRPPQLYQQIKTKTTIKRLAYQIKSSNKKIYSTENENIKDCQHFHLVVASPMRERGRGERELYQDFTSEYNIPSPRKLGLFGNV